MILYILVKVKVKVEVMRVGVLQERTRKNANGFYFDSPTFVFANQRWYLRVYPTKANSNGLPAVYLYLATKTQGLSIETQFQVC
jgi:hypothetical protein